MASNRQRSEVDLTDPRISIIDERLKEIDRIIAVSSGKGGVGKSLIASTLALSLARKGYSAGLFDLDFTSPSTHAILGIRKERPKEEEGIVPPWVHGLKYMSITYYSHDLATPLRGADVSNALVELLATTRWGKLNYLVLDMPPGLGDATLDAIRFIKNAEFLIITTPSRLAFEAVKRLVTLLQALKVPVLGVVENMKMNNLNVINEETMKLGLKFLQEIPFDSEVEAAIGDPDKLLRTVLADKVKQLCSKILETWANNNLAGQQGRKRKV
jgi:ATP-binding protein involved in chromosome partitioning